MFRKAYIWKEKNQGAAMKRYTKLKWGILAELALLFVLLAVKLSSERAEDASSAAVVAEEVEEA